MGSTLSSLNSNPLVSVLVSFYVLVLLYAPHLFLRLLFSPVLISTGALLAGILHLGSTKKQKQPESPKQVIEIEHGESEKEEERERKEVFRQDRRFSDVFVEWNRRAPLEVIYEDCEGEEGEKMVAREAPKNSPPVRGWKETCPLGLCYPDSDSESSSDGSFPAMEEWERPENLCFQWEEEKDDGLIEIPISLGKDTCRSEGGGLGFFPVEEDNLIEINLFDQTVIKSPRFPGKIQADTHC